MNDFDLAIVGMGPAGLTAGLYACRYNLRSVVFGSSLGQAADASIIENFPGTKSTSGAALLGSMMEQVQSAGAKLDFSNITEIVRNKNGFSLKTDSDVFNAKAVILATGANARKLGVPGEKELFGKGVAYCVTCEAPLFKDKIVGVVGGGDSALTGALMAIQHAKKVFLIHRRNEFRAEPAWQKKVKETKGIDFVLNAVVKKINGTQKVESVTIVRNGKDEELKLDGLFIEIGHIPSVILAQKLGVRITEKGLVKVDEEMRTNIEGIWVAGDVADTMNNINQIITACASGAIAANSVFSYFKRSGLA
jgi:thioredoxin reductase (NADPH)